MHAFYTQPKTVANLFYMLLSKYLHMFSIDVKSKKDKAVKDLIYIVHAVHSSKYARSSIYHFDLI